MPQFSAHEIDAIEVFRGDPGQQEDVRGFMAEQGADFGKMLTEMISRELQARVLFSNSGRCKAAAIVRRALEKQRQLHLEIGHDEMNVETFQCAARAEVSWLGV